jgi:hypothetical protein
MSVSTVERGRSKKAASSAAHGPSPEWADALRIAVTSASALGSEKNQALLDLPDEQVGSLFKDGLRQVLATLNAAGLWFDSASDRRSMASAAGKASTGSAKEKRLDLAEFERQALPVREALVSNGALLSASEFRTALDVSRQALSKAVNDGRIFTVDVRATQYYPAFFVSPDIDRKTLAKVTKQLGTIPGWSKWQFFTTRKGSLGGSTPLEALKRGDVKAVTAAANAFAEQ